MTCRLFNCDVLDGLARLEAGSVQVCITSPPYWRLRDYRVAGQIGLEPTLDDHVMRLVEVFRGVRRVLRDDGTLWLNLGDSYAKSSGAIGRAGNAPPRTRIAARQIHAHPKTLTGANVPEGLKAKDLMGMPWRIAQALRDDGWYLRADIIWHKPNPVPESVTDRPTKAHEYLFLLSKRAHYFYDADAIRQKPKDNRSSRSSAEFRGRSLLRHRDPEKFGLTRGLPNASCTHPKGSNRRSVWTVPSAPFRGAHFATFPPKLIEPCVLAGSRVGDTVLDPFSGSGTTGVVALANQRNYVGIELNPEYAELSRQRLMAVAPESAVEVVA